MLLSYINLLGILTIVINVKAVNVTSVQNNSTPPNENNMTIQQKQWLFRDYIKKFSPVVVWKRIDEENKALGVNKTVKDELENVLKGIDETDELLSLKVEDGDAKIILERDGRKRWVPPGKYDENRSQRDPFYLRKRFFELMKQAIYQARNKMVLMQMFRKKYSSSPLYKMGFLFSKTDTRCKIFSKFAFRSYKACSTLRQGKHYRHDIYGALQTEERLVQIWFEIELLTDLIVQNDVNCKAVIKKYQHDRIKHWKFID
ncbi:uncharacterized protein LOC116413437 [Galleria mellonella]|uniref:Uncharacterized protein LOC116413437 n=1 Tax=Galleria mellonella TaxID=7137 RepID=A0A6J3C7Y0_GALME|nr:uncharacterized protein LOC116413437 [Galleria mellonella]